MDFDEDFSITADAFEESTEEETQLTLKDLKSRGLGRRENVNFEAGETLKGEGETKRAAAAAMENENERES